MMHAMHASDSHMHAILCDVVKSLTLAFGWLGNEQFFFALIFKVNDPTTIIWIFGPSHKKSVE